MPKVADNLRDAQILADFSNLEPGQVDYFRNNYPDFAPQTWWNYRWKDGLQQWQRTRKLLREFWKNQFRESIFNLIALLESVTDPLRLVRAEWAGFEKVKKEFGEQAAEETAKRILGRALTPPSEIRVDANIPLQRAIVYLFENPWRARFCAECNKRFVAAEPKNKFCSETCSHNNRNRQKLKAWHAHKHEWRPTRKELKMRRGGK